MKRIWIVLALGVLARGNVEAAELELWTFNLRYASAKDPNSWSSRRPVVKALLSAEKPDIIGTQEGLYHQIRDLQEDLPEYRWVGTGREGGSRGEFMAIFYRKKRFEPLEFDHLWLSDTPRLVASKTWGNNVVRMITWVRFRDRRDGSEFLVVNTHFDHESAKSRIKSAEFLREWIDNSDPTIPVLVTGDFNAAAGSSAPYQALVKGDVKDTWEVAEKSSPVFATYHGYRAPRPSGARIDWVLGRGINEVRGARILTFSIDGQYPSDHFPVSALVNIQNKTLKMKR